MARAFILKTTGGWHANKADLHLQKLIKNDLVESYTMCKGCGVYPQVFYVESSTPYATLKNALTSKSFGWTALEKNGFILGDWDLSEYYGQNI